MGGRGDEFIHIASAAGPAHVFFIRFCPERVTKNGEERPGGAGEKGGVMQDIDYQCPDRRRDQGTNEQIKGTGERTAGRVETED
jgi:hypothetical protein